MYISVCGVGEVKRCTGRQEARGGRGGVCTVYANGAGAGAASAGHPDSRARGLVNPLHQPLPAFDVWTYQLYFT